MMKPSRSSAMESATACRQRAESRHAKTFARTSSVSVSFVSAYLSLASLILSAIFCAIGCASVPVEPADWE